MIKIRFNFNLSSEYDKYLIDFIQSHKNQSRIIRDLLRAGYTALQNKNTTNDIPIVTPETHTIDTPKDTQKTPTSTTKKSPNEKIQWKIPKN